MQLWDDPDVPEDFGTDLDPDQDGDPVNRFVECNGWLPDRVTGRTGRSRVRIERECRQRGRGAAAELMRLGDVEDPIKKTIRNPIRRADQFDGYLRGHPGVTYRDAAEVFGVTAATVCHHLALLRRLPPDFVAWLREVEDPAILRIVTERRLRSITRARVEEREAACRELQARV